MDVLTALRGRRTTTLTQQAERNDAIKRNEAALRRCRTDVERATAAVEKCEDGKRVSLADVKAREDALEYCRTALTGREAVLQDLKAKRGSRSTSVSSHRSQSQLAPERSDIKELADFALSRGVRRINVRGESWGARGGYRGCVTIILNVEAPDAAAGRSAAGSSAAPTEHHTPHPGPAPGANDLLSEYAGDIASGTIITYNMNALRTTRGTVEYTQCPSRLLSTSAATWERRSLTGKHEC